MPRRNSTQRSRWFRSGPVQRLFAQSTLATTAASMVVGMLLPTVALCGVLARFAWGAPESDREKVGTAAPHEDRLAANQTENEPASSPKAKVVSAPASRSLDIVIAEHVIVWDGRILAWKEVVDKLRELRQAQGKPNHPHFYFTKGAHSAGHWKSYQAKVFEVYEELFEPAGVSLGSISPRAGPRYDVLRKPTDLIPDPQTLRSGVVLVQGRPKAGVLVVLVPNEGVISVMLKPDLTLRDPLDEVWTITDADGRFTLPVQPVHAIDKLAEPPTYALAALSPEGYRLADVPAEGEEARIVLQPLARVELTPVVGKPQQIDFSLRGGLPDRSPGFSIFGIDLRDKPLLHAVPPGKVTVRRSFEAKNGVSHSYPAESFEIAAGQSRLVILEDISAEEAERRWLEKSLRP